MSNNPKKQACNITSMLDVVLGEDRFPVNVEELALEYSLRIFPEEPIIKVWGQNLPNFEGALYGKSTSKRTEWQIAYNSAIESSQRINFTLAHEFGHYLLHRNNKNEFICSTKDLILNESYLNMESEANTFAADLLMPSNDFRKQIGNKDIDFDLIDYCTNRYQVSLTSFLLKWINYTKQRVMIVISRDQYILSARSSQNLFKNGIFIKCAGNEPKKVPECSLAHQSTFLADGRYEKNHDPGSWSKSEPVIEMAFCSSFYDIIISLIIYPDEYFLTDLAKETIADAFDKFNRFN